MSKLYSIAEPDPSRFEFNSDPSTSLNVKLVTKTVTIISVVDPNIFNLDPETEFWLNLDPDLG